MDAARCGSWQTAHTRTVNSRASPGGIVAAIAAISAGVKVRSGACGCAGCCADTLAAARYAATAADRDLVALRIVRTEYRTPPKGSIVAAASTTSLPS